MRPITPGRALALLCAVVMYPVASWGAEQTFIRGDCNADGEVDISDPPYLLNCIQHPSACPNLCQDAGDVNDSSIMNSADVTWLYDWLYGTGLPPRAPFPACGVDPTADNLVCSGHIFCDDGPGEVDLKPIVGILRIEDFTIPPDGAGTARIFAVDPDSTEITPVQSFQVSVDSPADLELVDINIEGTVCEQAGAEFIIAQIRDPDGAGRLVVVMDLEEPFDDLQVIPLGTAPLHIANFVYTCDEHPSAPSPPVVHSLSLSSSSFLFVEGRRKTPKALIDGTATCLPDACPDSDMRPTVVIDGCDSGVKNLALEDGCTMADQIAKCAARARNHGGFVSCVVHLTKAWRDAGLLSGNDHGAILRCAAKARIPRK